MRLTCPAHSNLFYSENSIANNSVYLFKINYLLVSRHQTTEQNHNIKEANKSFENVAKFFETTLTNQNFIYEEIRSRLNYKNSCYHKFIIFWLLVCYLKTIILTLFCVGVKPGLYLINIIP